jgi:hypothetical protein
LSQLAGGENGGRTSSGQALESIDFQGIWQFMIRLTKIYSEKIWVMTSPLPKGEAVAMGRLSNVFASLDSSTD